MTKKEEIVSRFNKTITPGDFGLDDHYVTIAPFGLGLIMREVGFAVPKGAEVHYSKEKDGRLYLHWEAPGKEEECVFLKCRGLGSDQGSCFHPDCTIESTLLSNIAAFVDSKEEGEKAVAMFERGAWLDYRTYEPKWIQVKICACDKHVEYLEKLYELVRKNNWLSRSKIKYALEGS